MQAELDNTQLSGTDTPPFHKSCSVYYAGNVSKGLLGELFECKLIRCCDGAGQYTNHLLVIFAELC